MILYIVVILMLLVLWLFLNLLLSYNYMMEITQTLQGVTQQLTPVLTEAQETWTALNNLYSLDQYRHCIEAGGTQCETELLCHILFNDLKGSTNPAAFDLVFFPQCRPLVT